MENNSKLVQDLCDRLKVDLKDNIEESKVSNITVSNGANDEDYEGDRKSDYSDIVVATAEPEGLNAMVSSELESSSTIVTNEKIDTTVISEKFTTTLQWIKELYAKDSKCALEYLEYVNNVSPEELDLTTIASLPEEVQKRVQWIVGLDTESRSELLENIKSLIISTSHDDKYNISYVQEVTKLERQDTLYEHADDLVGCY